jgi:hypothetical protein
MLKNIFKKIFNKKTNNPNWISPDYFAELLGKKLGFSKQVIDITTVVLNFDYNYVFKFQDSNDEAIHKQELIDNSEEIIDNLYDELSHDLETPIKICLIGCNKIINVSTGKYEETFKAFVTDPVYKINPEKHIF